MHITSFHDDHILFEQQIPSSTFLEITSSLLKLVNGITHGGDTWYSCILLRFYDDHLLSEQQQSLRHYFFFTPQLANGMEMQLGMHVYYIVSITTTYGLNNNKIPQSTFLGITSNLLTIARNEMKLGTHAYYIVFMMTTDCFTTKNSFRNFL